MSLNHGFAEGMTSVNYALNSLKPYMKEQAYTALAYKVTAYQNGDKSAREHVLQILRNEGIMDAERISNYLLVDSSIKLVGSFTVDHAKNELNPILTMGLVDINSNDYIVKNLMWSKITRIIPIEFTNNVTVINFEEYRNADNLAEIRPSDGTLNTWEISIDVSLFDAANEEEFKKHMVYLTAYYYLLRADQADLLTQKKDNYNFYGITYRDYSYINLFYKRFWKGMSESSSKNLYKLNKNKFINSKAARSVHDDMAVSFYQYVTKGVMRTYFGYRSDKSNFFDDHEFFKNLAINFRGILGINVS